ncbi:hypothetical protein DFH29DRAFT_936866, partial [Suillus ampliporus]
MGDLRWRHNDGHDPGCEEFDWVIDYLARMGSRDEETECDALLALSTMKGLGSSAKRPSYIKLLIRYMESNRYPRVRLAALRAVYEARGELAAITSDSMPQGVNAQLLDKLSCALLAAVRPNHDQAIQGSGSKISFRRNRELYYNDEWCQRLIRDRHIGWCISLADEVYDGYLKWCLNAIFARINPSGKDLPFSPAQDSWRVRIKHTWGMARYGVEDDEYVDAIPALVTATRLNLLDSDNGVPSEWLTDLATRVYQESQAIFVNNGVAQAAVDAAISSAQGLYDDMPHRMIEHRSASQGVDADMPPMVEDWNTPQSDL